MSAKRQKLVGELNAALGADGVVFLEESKGLGTKAVVTCGGAKVELWTFGAHVVSWQVEGVERTWMSRLSKMDGSAPIRGGVPLAWPQFADQGSLPLHGFARTQVWTVGGTATTQTAGGPRTSITLTLADSPETLAIWPHKFSLSYTLTLGPRSISFELTASNTDESAWPFTGCLHTYLGFDDSSLVEIHGLDGTKFIDKCDGLAIKTQYGGPIVAPDEAAKSGADAGKPGFVDRIYLDSPKALQVKLKGSDAVLYNVNQSSSWPDTTLYNPWKGDKLGGAAAGLDFDEDGFQKMFCIEPTIGRGEKPVILASGEKFVGSQTISIP